MDVEEWLSSATMDTLGSTEEPDLQRTPSHSSIRTDESEVVCELLCTVLPLSDTMSELRPPGLKTLKNLEHSLIMSQSFKIAEKETRPSNETRQYRKSFNIGL